MISAPLPNHESDRIAALERYQILDTESEELFDSIVHLAATICDVPIALISLVDKNRQWFKAKVGLDAGETPRELAFCAHAILQPEEIMIVKNASADERFHDNPLVSGSPDIRFYAGSPIVTKDNQPLGTLCIIDKEPRDLSDEQLVALKHLSNQVCANLDLRLKTRKLELLNESKNRYFSILSHDLRAPINSVVSIAELLNDTSLNLDKDESAELISHLKDNAETTLEIAENLLKMAQFEQGTFKYDPEYLLVSEIVKSAQFAVSGKIVTKKIGLGVDCPTALRVWADRGMLQSILQNILSNAVKFTPVNGNISIVAQITNNQIRIEVQDSGTGIAPNILERIFELDSCYSTEGTEGERGSGLGLTLCNQFAQKLGGDLHLESVLGKGTLATLNIPVTETGDS